MSFRELVAIVCDFLGRDLVDKSLVLEVTRERPRKTDSVAIVERFIAQEQVSREPTSGSLVSLAITDQNIFMILA